MHRKLLMAAATLALTAGAALAQQARSPESVVLLTGDAGQTYSTLGAISVETHQTSMFPKISREQQLETELRKQAAAMGADAVIHVKYEYSSALTSKKGNKALGVAVKFAAAAAPAVAAPVQPIPAPAPAIVATAPAAPVIASPAPAPATTPVPTPLPSPAAPAATPAPAPVTVAPVTAAPVIVAPVTVAPAPVVHATTPEMVMLSESAIPGRPYTKLRTITVTTHQTSMFPKTPAMTDLQNALKAEALKAGADAVIEVKYTMTNPMMSKKGNTAVGVAVRFD